MLNALLSVPNPKFIEQIKDRIDSGIGLNNQMLHDDLSTKALVKYKKVVASNEYSKLDTKDAETLALTTKVNSIEQSVSTNLENVTSGGGSGGI